MQRYQRQIQLSEVGLAGQQRLSQAKILVVGAGGLSATLLPQLVGAGVGFIRLYDADRVALDNLHRQTLFRQTDIGKAKALVASQALAQCNSDVCVEPQIVALGASTLTLALEDIDLVVDAADNFATTYLLSSACLARNLPLISASVLGMTGYVGGFCDGAPSYRALFPELPARAGNCQQSGVFGPVVATLAAIQSQMVLSTLLQLSPSPLGCMVKCDFKRWQFSQFRFDQASEPVESTLVFIDRQQLQADDVIIELRSFDEAPHSVADNAVRQTVEQLINYQVPEDRRTVLVCRTGLRAARAERILRQQGVSNIVLLAAEYS